MRDFYNPPREPGEGFPPPPPPPQHKSDRDPPPPPPEVGYKPPVQP